MWKWRTLSQVLFERGFKMYGVGASARMIAAFRARFRTAHLGCAAAENSDFLGRSFNGVVAGEAQRKLIQKVAAALASDGRLLFTAPKGSVMVARPRGIPERLEQEGMRLVETYIDEGEKHYYSAQR